MCARAEEVWMIKGKVGRWVAFGVGLSVAVAAWVGPTANAQGASPATSAVPASGPRIGFVTHAVGDPFLEEVIEGARAAAADTGVQLTVAEPEGGSGNPQLIAIQNLVDAGVQGIATSVPGENMAGALNELIDSGIPVVQYNLHQVKVNAPYVGNRTKESGRILGHAIVEKLGGASATGTVIVGNCYPKYSVLEDRAAGVLESLDLATITGVGAGLAPPGLKIVGPLDTTYQQTTNYAAWQAALTTDPDAKALIGLCGTDLPNLIKLKQANPSAQFLSGGYDLTDAAVSGIKAGDAYVTLDQTPFMQGYIPVKILADTLTGASAVDLQAGGFIDAGTEVVTQDAVAEPFGLPPLTIDQRLGLATDPAAARAYYGPAIDGFVNDWVSHLEPAVNESN
jgi:ABC-type sugar transport system substrate-binding protein